MLPGCGERRRPREGKGKVTQQVAVRFREKPLPERRVRQGPGGRSLTPGFLFLPNSCSCGMALRFGTR